MLQISAAFFFGFKMAMAVKTRFRLVYEQGVDPKSNIVKVKLIEELQEGKIYLFPPNLQPLTEHPALAGLPVIKAVIKVFTKRNQFRNIKVTLPEEIVKKYFDEEGNVRFKENYLEEYNSNKEELLA